MKVNFPSEKRFGKRKTSIMQTVSALWICRIWKASTWGAKETEISDGKEILLGPFHIHISRWFDSFSNAPSPVLKNPGEREKKNNKSKHKAEALPLTYLIYAFRRMATKQDLRIHQKRAAKWENLLRYSHKFRAEQLHLKLTVSNIIA